MAFVSIKAAPGRVQQVPVPPAARALSTLARIDYEDAFVMEIDPALGLTGEQWARATLDAAPSSMRRQLWLTWLALGLRLGAPRSARRVLGWEVRHSDSEFALLGARSWVGMPGELLFKPEGPTLLFATFVQQRNPVVRALWSAVEPGHQRVVPYLLRRAGRARVSA